MKKNTKAKKPDKKKLIIAVIAAAIIITGVIIAVVLAVRNIGGGSGTPATYSDVPQELIDELLRESEVGN